MSRLSYFLDENVDHAPVVAAGLRDRGVDAITADEAGRAGHGIPDQAQLEYASSQGRVMVTQDLRFAPRAPHSGLVVMQRKLSLGEYILYLQIVAEQYGSGDLKDQGSLLPAVIRATTGVRTSHRDWVSGVRIP